MFVMGIDEVGRGCWAGPLVAGAVILSDNYTQPVNSSWVLADSKVLNKRQRQSAAAAIAKISAGWGLGWVSSSELDDIGLTAAVRLAMQRALQAATTAFDAKQSGLPVIQPTIGDIVIDGSFNFLSEQPLARTVIKADASVPAVSAASIMAKVARDQWMTAAATQYPGYGFEHHVGYGTSRHRQAIADLGVCPLHRRSFKPIAAVL